MMEAQHPPAPLQRERDQVVEGLVDHYAAGNLTIEEFEERLDTAYTAQSGHELARVLDGLPVLSGAPGGSRGGQIQRLPIGEVRERGRHIAILGYYQKRGRWAVPRRMTSFAIMSATSLDFREARLPPGTTEVKLRPIMGHVEVIVPPGLEIETHGFGFMGGIEGVDQEGADPDPEAPRLVIRGTAIMGYVEVAVRLPGETAEDARRRQQALQRHERQKLIGRG